MLQPVKAAPYFAHAQFGQGAKTLALRDPGADPEQDPSAPRQVHRFWNAPSRRAIRRYTIITTTGTVANADASGRLFATPTFA